MKLPLQITFRNMPRSPALAQRIEELAARLDEASNSTMRCHVRISLPHAHKGQGRLFDVRIEITAPEKEIAIVRAYHLSAAHEDAFHAVRDVFRAARRKLLDYERRRRLDVKAHSLAAAPVGPKGQP
jgi:ribosome-associated translation inhibitor RaiA